MLHRRIAHVVAWTQGAVGGLASSVPEPSPGMASRFDSDSEEADVPVLGKAALQTMLRESAMLAGCAELGDDRDDEDGVTAFGQSMLAYGHLMVAIRAASPDLPDRFVAVMRAAERAMAEAEEREVEFAHPDLVGTLSALAHGVVVIVGSASPSFADVPTWLTWLTGEFGYRTEIEGWAEVVQLVDEVVRGDSRRHHRLSRVLADESAPSSHRLIAAAALARSGPDLLFRDRALAVLITTLAVHPFGNGTGAAAAAIAGLNVSPGQGVQAAARDLLSRRDPLLLDLSPGLTAALERVATDGPTWGMGGPSPVVTGPQAD